MRKKLQGTRNIIAFNWHFYLLAAIAILILLLIGTWIEKLAFLTAITSLAIILSILSSLLASAYIYDFSNLYDFDWIEESDDTLNIINIHAGFDETSTVISQKFKKSKLTVLDFYDPNKHREISIRRARKKYPAYPGTLSIDTTKFPLLESKFDRIFVIFSAHEIRDDEERTAFLINLKKLLRSDAEIYLMEHLQDLPNFLAFNVGFFHFHSDKTWRKNILKAGLSIEQKTKFTPFISIYKLI